MLGNIPLPVVEKGWFIYPSIFPYVDFEEQKFVRDSDRRYFVYNDQPNSEAEIRHGLIDFDNDITSYLAYFDKLRDYHDNPLTYVAKKFWYDDFIDLKDGFNLDLVPYYVNNFVFSEDMGYHRFTTLLLDLFNNEHLNAVNGLLGEFTIPEETDDDADDYDTQQQDALADFFRSIADSFAEAETLSSASTAWTNTPTLLIQQSLETFFKNYSDLAGTSYLARMRDNVLAGGRRDIEDLHSHLSKVVQKDGFLSNTSLWEHNPILVEMNTLLEEIIVDTVAQEHYAMHVPLTTNYRSYRNQIEVRGPIDGLSCRRERYYLDGEYDLFYFGKNANDISDAKDLSIYRWSYLNLTDSETASQFPLSAIPSVLGVDHALQSVGWSFHLFDRQVKAHRWYNMLLAGTDQETYTNANPQCGWLGNFVDAYRWGYTPLNLEQQDDWSLDLKSERPDLARNPSFDKTIGWPLYDPAGARLVEEEQPVAYSREAVNEYPSVQRTRRQVDATETINTSININPVNTVNFIRLVTGLRPRQPGERNVNYCETNARENLDYNTVEFFNTYNTVNAANGEYNDITVNGPDGQAVDVREDRCASVSFVGMNFGWAYKTKENYEYTTLDSTIIHNTPTPEQVSELNITTLERPIDSRRHMTFLWIWGDTVELEFPNLYEIPVYDEDDEGNMTLKSVDDITLALIQYLRSHVQTYNQTLQEQLSKSATYYASQQAGFDFLAQANSLATPHRTYQLLDDNFLVEALNGELDTIAKLLSYQNSLRQELSRDETAVGMIGQAQSSANINHKVQWVLDAFLTKDMNQWPLITPGYVDDGYEVAYINSDWFDYIANDTTPAFIELLQSQQIDFDSSLNNQQGRGELPNDIVGDDDQVCGVPATATLPLVSFSPVSSPWFDWFMCWLKETLKKPVEFTVNFANAEWPVIVMDQFKSVVEEKLENTLEWFETFDDTLTAAFDANSEEEEKIAALSPQQQEIFTNLRRNFQPKLSDNELFLEPIAWVEQQKFMIIRSLQDPGEVTISIASTGDNCAQILNINTCEQPYDIVINPFLDEQLIPFSLVDTQAGTMNVTYTICLREDLCTTKTDRATVLPGELASIAIETPYRRLIAWGAMPVVVNGYDQFANSIGLSIYNYDIVFSTWTINGQAGGAYTFNRFSDQAFAYQAPTLTGASALPVTVTVQPTPSSVIPDTLPSTSSSFTVVPAFITVLSWNETVTWLSYTLPDSRDTISHIDDNGIQQVDPTGLLSFRIRIADPSGIWLPTNMRLTSQKWLVSPGIIRDQFTTKTVDGVYDAYPQTVFLPHTQYDLPQGEIEIYVYPKMIAGQDTLLLTIPGRETITIPLTIHAGTPSTVVLDNDTDNLRIDESYMVDAYVTDTRWNDIIDDVTLQVGTFGPLMVNDQERVQVTTQSGTASFTVRSHDPGWQGFIYAYIDDLSIQAQRPDYFSLIVQNSLLPTDNLNIMRLNLFGRDRGNMRGYFSDVESVVRDLLTDSEKLLNITTQLIDYDSLHRFTSRITPTWRLIADDNEFWNLEIEQWAIRFVEPIIGSIGMGWISDYEIISLQSTDSLSELDQTDTMIVYVPEISDNRIAQNVMTDNQIIVDGEVIIDFDEWSVALSALITHTIDTERKLSVLNLPVGRLYVHRGDQQAINIGINDLALTNPDRWAMVMFGDGSTNGQQALGIFDRTSTLSDDWFSSIQQSDQPDEQIGFRHDFHHISSFAQWLSIGDATRDVSSDILINYGDPLIERISDNETIPGTDFDGWPWQTVYTNMDETIMTTKHTDFNNDGLTDLLLFFQDGTVELLKNYGWTDPYNSMWPVMLIEDAIQEVFMGDVDGNEYEDIIIRLSNNSLRVYLNNQWVYNVDGIAVCLNIPGWPEDMNEVMQLFVEDMDLDGSVDIITHDRDGYVRIFYGGTSTSWPTYLSQSGALCDEQRQERVGDESIVVKRFGMQLATWLQIVDDSLVHRQWLSVDDQDLFSADNLPEQVDGITTIDPVTGVPQLTDFDIGALIAQGSQNFSSRAVSPTTTAPLYEDIDIDSLRYKPIRELLSIDPVKVYKTYEDLNGDLLQQGDTVQITVTIENTSDLPVTYFESIVWPWVLTVDEQGLIDSFSSGTLTSDAIIDPRASTDFLFMIDNIEPAPVTTFSYEVEFQWGTNIEIAIEQINDDDYPDIKLYPLDGCAKLMRQFINAVSDVRTYNEELKDLNEEMQNYLNNAQKDQENFIGDARDTVEDIMTNQDLSILQDKLWVGEVRWWLGDIGNRLLQWGKASFNLDLNILGGISDEIESALQDSLKWLCQWFKLGGEWWCNQWLPVPFNMAFLAPGTFNVFGCRLFEDKWLPAFWFPGTVQTPVWPVPFPRWLLGPGDNFGYFGLPPRGWIYPSQIRIYASPTLTQKMGVAICLGPYGADLSLPAPVGDISGNCIVTAINFDQSCDAWVWNGSGDMAWLPERMKDLSKFWPCNLPPIRPDVNGSVDQNNNGTNNTSDSPFQLMAGDEWWMWSALPEWTYGLWLVSFEAQPITVDAARFGDSEWVTLKTAGGRIKNSIQWGMQEVKGIVKCIVTDRLDEQIKYLVNNLSSMTITLALPDVTTLTQWFDQLDIDRLSQQQQNQPNFEEKPATGTTAPGAWVRDKRLKQSDVISAGNTLNNPFDALATMFETVPLVNINTKDVNLQIPMIYAEDITRYTQYLQWRLNTNRKTLEERQKIVQWVIGICGQQVGRVDSSRGVTTSDATNAVVNWWSSSPTTGWSTTGSLAGSWEDEVKALDLPIKNRQKAIKQALAKLQACKDHKENKRPGEEPNELCAGRTIAQIDDEIAKLEAEQTMTNNCAKFLFGWNNIGVRNGVNVNLANYFAIRENTQILIRNVNENIKVLQQYKQFPLELYERVHVTDRYLSEVSSVVDAFLTNIALWLKTNAARFDQYVDAILVMIGSIKTRQVLIDFSVNRQEKCSKCTNDNYDYYACSLGALCVKLPILPIPPFKIPNIYLDFSHIDVGIDVLLPNFNFVPTAVPLPRIPNIPQPPQINGNFDIANQANLAVEWLQFLGVVNDNFSLPNLSLPNIPVMPKPPTLPPLPSYLPTPNLKLPVLPPAPEIPKIAPQIQWSLKVAEFIGQIFCIIKWGVWLVQEARVKTRIEQLTQRTRDVAPFDNFDLTNQLYRAPLQWFDFRVDSFVMFRYNFDYVYELIDGFAQLANEATTQLLIEPTQQWVDNFSKELQENNPTQDFQRWFNVDLNAFMESDELSDRLAQLLPMGDMRKQYEGTMPYEEAYRHLMDWLHAMHNKAYNSRLEEDTQELISLVDHDYHVTPQIDALESIGRDTDSVLWQRSSRTQQLAQRLTNDYDSFLDELAQQEIQLIDDETFSVTFNGSLFSADKELVDLLTTEDHPLSTYFDLHKQMLEWFDNAISNHSPEQLAMDAGSADAISEQITYLQKNIGTMQAIVDGRQEIDTFAWVWKAPSGSARRYLTRTNTCSVDDEQQQITYERYRPAMYAQAGGGIPSNGSAWADLSQFDISQYVKGVFVKADDNSYVDVVQSDYFIDQITNNYTLADINNDTHDDMIARDEHHVYLKYAQQQDTHITDRTRRYARYYQAPVMSNADSYQTRTQSTNGYLTIDDLRLKVAMPHYEVKNFATQWQTYESITLGWTTSEQHSDDVAWYLVKFIQRVDSFDTDELTNSFVDEWVLNKQYVLMVPANTNTWTLRINVPGELTAKPVSEYLTGTIRSIEFYESDTQNFSLTMTEIPRQRHYFQVISLRDSDDSDRQLFTQWSPRSNQIVAWPQEIADDIPPFPFVQLRRVETDQIADEWVGLQWFINTTYDLEINRVDNVAVHENTLTRINGQSYTSSWWTFVLTGLFYEDIGYEDFFISAIDHNDNSSAENIILTIDVPDISIVDIQKRTDSLGNIIAEISQDIDEWSVQFEKNRRWLRQPLTGITEFNQETGLFPVDVSETIVTGGLFSLSEDIALSLDNGTQFARLDAETAELTILPRYQDRMEVSVSFRQNIPVISIRDNEQNKRIFSIYLPAQARTAQNSIVITDGTYTSTRLQKAVFGEFDGGSCIKQLQGDCIMYVSPDWLMYVPVPYNSSIRGAYRFDADQQAVVYDINTITGEPIWSVSFIAQPLVN